MDYFVKPVLLLFFVLVLILPSCREQEAPPVMHPQHPSPMVEYTRPHHRVPIDSLPDATITVDLSNEFKGTLYLPEKWKNEPRLDLLIHFHGDRRVAQYAVDQQTTPYVLFHCQWGSGSSAYSRPVQQLGADRFLDTILTAAQRIVPGAQISSVSLSGWSAGYGAIRSILSEETAADRIDGVLLLDGLHCSYVPEGKVMAEGGALDSIQMQPFLNWAKRAAAGERSFFITHSSVFPGTFASTTETAEYILQSLGISRRPLLEEGPLGMQQTSVAGQGKLQIISFAGNSAPDHVDHYHGMGAFLRRLP